MIECRYNCKHYDWSVGACNGECGIEKHFSLGYQQGRADVIDEFVIKCKEWNKTSSKRIPYKAIEEISKQLKEQNG